MAAPYSATVFTLSSARGLGCSSSSVSALIRNLRGQFLPPASWAAMAARARLEDGAQRLGQPVVAGTEGGGVAPGITARDQQVERRGIEERQVTGQHQPGGVGVFGQRRADAGDRSFDVATIHDARPGGAHRIVGLLGAHRDERARHARREQLHRSFELGLAAVVGDGRLVALHARAAAAGEHQAEQWRRRVHLRLRGALPRLTKLRLPPCLLSSRTGPISMSCDSALHMS
jgi:hypothetical protein